MLKLDEQLNYISIILWTIIGLLFPTITYAQNWGIIPIDDMIIPYRLPPEIVSFTPKNGYPSEKVTITGKNFTGATRVTYGDINSNILAKVISDTTIEVYLPPPGYFYSSTVLSPGTYPSKESFIIYTPGGSAVSSESFEVIVPPIKFTGFTPTHGGAGTEVKISASNLNLLYNGIYKVEFNGVKANVITVNSNYISVTVPMDATSGPIKITSLAGQVQDIGNFNVITTCGGKQPISSAQYFNILFKYPNGCGDSITAFANSLSEAKECVTNLGFIPVQMLCRYKLNDSNFNLEWEVTSSSRDDAAICVKNTWCGNCSPVVTQDLVCIQAP